MKIIGWIVYLIWIVCIPFLIISSTVTVVSHSYQLYQYGFDKYQISKVTGIGKSQLDEVSRKMIEYYYGRSDSPQVTVTIKGKDMPVYSQKELVHLADVRAIIQLFGLLQIISMVLLFLSGLYLYLRSSISRILKGLIIGAAATLAFTGILVAWALIDFNSLFILFHIVSFNNNLWILDPAHDYLIMMFPEGFFNDAAVLLVTAILVEAGIILTAAILIKNKLLGEMSGPVDSV